MIRPIMFASAAAVTMHPATCVAAAAQMMGQVMFVVVAGQTMHPVMTGGAVVGAAQMTLRAIDRLTTRSS
ncbi:hypothetical protein Q4610_19140 [Sphingobium sp. HBC34]|uniref:Secreted protein n=1 Tax=Sphingobium cyanobacteriorum TaxID=3063954 RepID=A0ABT8ZRJ2_9SPHN|nr:hypothetical protein [Sphingobium sp. HBC34]MDO7837165.1 hypothetical protein [Sphingobium sp. HBC34]